MKKIAFASILTFLGWSFLAACTPSVATMEKTPTPQPSPSPLPQLSPTPSEPPLPTLAPGQEAILDVSLEDAISLAGQWRYSKVDLFNPEMTLPEYDDSAWDETYAPASWEEQGMGEWIGSGTVVIYRRRIEIPESWKNAKIGISAWFNPFGSSVFVNGVRAEPERKPFAPYADVSEILLYGQSNTLAVTVMDDGYLEFAEAGAPRIGRLEMRSVTQILHEDHAIHTEEGEAAATLIRPAERKNLPAMVLVATGSHGLAEREPWFDLADDFARQGYASLVLALPIQKADGVLAGVEYLRSIPEVDPQKVIVFGVDQAAPAVVGAAIQDPSIRGVILLSAMIVEEIGQLENCPVLFLASEGDRRGYVLEQAKTMAQQVKGPTQVIALPGEGHGTFLFSNVWNPLRKALLEWLSENQLTP
jgi:dienelactone hydrolase